MRRRVFIILCAAIVVLLAQRYGAAEEPAGTEESGLKYVSRFEGGKLYRTGTIKVVELSS